MGTNVVGKLSATSLMLTLIYIIHLKAIET